MILLSLKILILLWMVNLAPPVLAFYLGDKWNMPLDRGLMLWDGRPFLGNHKTIRGIIAAILTGIAAGLLLGFSWWAGLCTASLSVLGDLVSSFIKRRAGCQSGSIVPGLDQFFEGAVPFLFLSPGFSLSVSRVIVLIIIFCVFAYIGSWFFKKLLSERPHDHYPRKISPLVRFREIKSCQIPYSYLDRILNFENAIYYHFFMKNTFKLLGIYNKGIHNALQVRINYFELPLYKLPSSFENYTILFITDLHLDGLDGITERIQSLVQPLKVDLCILGGDYRMKTYGSYQKMLLRIGKLAHTIQTKDGIYAVLGNHDCIEMIPELKKRGISVLLNDSEPIRRVNSRIWIAGIDDPHYYQCHDLNQAFSDVPDGEFTIFVAHSPEVYQEAATRGANLYLCGHTHAGQIQIPHIGPVFTHSKSPRRFCYGQWKYRDMIGYTSSGAGVSGVPVRFCTTGEVVHITLKK